MDVLANAEQSMFIKIVGILQIHTHPAPFAARSHEPSPRPHERRRPPTHGRAFPWVSGTPLSYHRLSQV